MTSTKTKFGMEVQIVKRQTKWNLAHCANLFNSIVLAFAVFLEQGDHQSENLRTWTES